MCDRSHSGSDSCESSVKQTCHCTLSVMNSLCSQPPCARTHVLSLELLLFFFFFFFFLIIFYFSSLRHRHVRVEPRRQISIPCASLSCDHWKCHAGSFTFTVESLSVPTRRRTEVCSVASHLLFTNTKQNNPEGSWIQFCRISGHRRTHCCCSIW